MNKELLFIDMDGVLVDFEAKVTRLENDAAVKKHPSQEYHHLKGFYKDLDPIPFAIDAFHLLSEKYDVYILSAPSWNNISSWTDKRVWVDEHLGSAVYKKLILSHNKGIFTGRALIDDAISNGQENFNGEFIRYGHGNFTQWEQILEHLI